MKVECYVWHDFTYTINIILLLNGWERGRREEENLYVKILEKMNVESLVSQSRELAEMEWSAL